MPLSTRVGLSGYLPKRFARRHRQHADLAALDERRPLRAVGHELDVAAQQRRHELRAALVGDVGEARAGRLLGLEHQQMAGAADAAGPVVQLLGLALARRDQVPIVCQGESARTTTPKVNSDRPMM